MSLNWGKGLVQRPALFLLLVFQWSSWRRRPIPLLPLVASASSSTGGADLSLLRYRRRRCWFFLRRPSPRPPLLLLSPEFADGAPGKPSSRLHPSTFFFFFLVWFKAPRRPDLLGSDRLIRKEDVNLVISSASRKMASGYDDLQIISKW